MEVWEFRKRQPLPPAYPHVRIDRGVRKDFAVF